MSLSELTNPAFRNTFPALCATVGFSLESANVVGFVQPSLQGNANLAGAPFDMVGAEGMDIQQIKPAGEGLYGGAVTLKLLKSDLSDDAEYFFLPPEEAPDGETAGWYLDDYATLVEKTFGPGEGFILVNSLDDANATYSGQVIVGKPTWEIAANANLAGNITPVPLNIQDIVVGTAVDENGNLTDENNEIYGGSITVKLLNTDLSDKAEYFYLPAAEAPDGVTAGWYLDDYATLVELTFAPGEGFILVSNFDSAFAQIPAALTAE